MAMKWADSWTGGFLGRRVLAGGPSRPQSQHQLKHDETGHGYSASLPTPNPGPNVATVQRTEQASRAQSGTVAMPPVTSPLAEEAMLSRRAASTAHRRWALPVREKPEGGEPGPIGSVGGRPPAGGLLSPSKSVRH
jgi:hypothetical protein